jgi:hypothetical protein
MMAVNGSPVSDTLVWSETVRVAQNTEYNFSAWVSTWDPNYTDAAKLDFIFNGRTISFTAPNTPAKWRQFATTWNSGPSNSLKIEIYDRNLHRLGNDFALDDISLTAVPDHSTERPSSEKPVREPAKHLDGESPDDTPAHHGVQSGERNEQKPNSRTRPLIINPNSAQQGAMNQQ